MNGLLRQASPGLGLLNQTSTAGLEVPQQKRKFHVESESEVQSEVEVEFESEKVQLVLKTNFHQQRPGGLAV